MIRFAILLVSCTYLHGLADAVQYDSLRVKFTPQGSGQYAIPLTVKSIKGEYVLLKAHEEFPQASIYCYPDDPRVCPIYDHFGNIAGLRVAYIKDDIKKKANGKAFPYSYDNKPIFQKGSAFKIEFFYIDILFISADSLKNGGPATRSEPTGDGVYVKIDGKTWTSAPRKETDVAMTKFKKQACYPAMGQHYFYNLDKKSKCEDIVPMFILYHEGELVGLGLAPFGAFTSKKRVWFEDVPEPIVKAIFPNGPTCLAEWTQLYGGTSLHIYLTSSKITCPAAKT